MYCKRNIRYYAPTPVNSPVPRRLQKLPSWISFDHNNLTIDLDYDTDDEPDEPPASPSETLKGLVGVNSSKPQMSGQELTRALKFMMGVGESTPEISIEEKTRALRSALNIA